MTLIEVSCSFCNKKFFRTLGRFNEAKKFGWKHYCSLKCQSLAKNKQKTFRCANPKCDKIFKRQLNKIPRSGICFCSRSCAAIVNNQKSAKKKTCPTCRRQFLGRRKYCSQACIPKPQIVTKEKIIKEIKKFYYNDSGRVPLKREYFHYKAVWLRFGSWNKAIKAAGFDPNPVLFAKKFIANDGHHCDSLSEKIIDDWLYARKIEHKINVPYPQDKSLTVDFLVKDYWIEFFGLDGELKSYDSLKNRKLQIAKEKNLNLIAIYPKDLFPKCKLNKKLSSSI